MLNGVNPAAVTLVRNGLDVTLVIAESAAGAGDGGSVLLKNQLDDYYGRGIEQIVFGDGTIWTASQLRMLLVSVAGTSGNDTITGTNTDDVISGGLGNDALNGKGGNDTYVYARGDGNDTITEETSGGTADKLVLDGVNQAAVTLVRNGLDVTLVIAESAAGAGDGGSVLLKNQLDDYYGRGIEQIVFGDGTICSPSDLRVMTLAAASTAGNDTIVGFNTNDNINGGAGNDALNGKDGNDTYVYARGDGNDTITEETSGGTADKLVLNGVNPAAVTLVRNGLDVTLVIAESAAGAGDGGSVLLKNQLDDYYGRGIEQIIFGDGTIWSPSDLRVMTLAVASTAGNDTIVGFNTNDNINGGAGNDALNGKGGNDTYVYARGDGNDTITEETSGGTADKLVLDGVNQAAVTLVRNGLDVTLVIAESAAGAGDGGSVLLKNQLDDYYGRGIEQIVFGDGTICSPSDLRVMTLAAASTAGNDTIVGFNTNDNINGGAGNDALNGKDGNDTYVYARGDGNDTITEETSGGTADKLVLNGVNPAAVTLVRNGLDVTLVIAESAAGAGDGGSVLLKNQLDDYYGRGIEQIIFGDGTIWSPSDLRVMTLAVASTAGNDTIVGFNTNDNINGGAGNDALNGKDGNDTYVYARGDGNDTITEETSGGTADKLVLNGVNPAAVTLVRNGLDVTLVIAESAAGAGDGGSVLLKNQLDDYYGRGIEQIIFGDGTIWSPSDLRVMTLAVASTAGNDTIVGFNTNDIINGGAGNDNLSGADGSDRIVGGTGNDSLTGGSGPDTFAFAPGNGIDTILDFKDTSSENDIIEFGNMFSSFSAVQAASAQLGSDVVITVSGLDKITIKSWSVSNMGSDDFSFV